MSQPQYPESSPFVPGGQPVYPAYRESYGQPSFVPPYTVDQGTYGAAAVSRPPRTNGFAIAALILGVVACSPLALPFAIVALVQTRSGRQRGRELAIGALVASAVWIVITVVAFATGALRFTTFVSNTLPSAGGPAAHISVGNCIDSFPSLAPGAATHVGKVETISCDRPHDAQVMVYTNLPDGPWPGAGAVMTDAQRACDSVLATMLANVSADVHVRTAFAAPDSASSWNESHSAACLFVRATDQKLTHRID
ncbi:DUF4190 domain-containing protein [Nocardia sp. CA-135953]|uniref:DUF4190 domain-containing protein n=1 Tax=Nocardia sp. CA-135953 TaxID=3239978 RepID=UPI003D9843DD